MKTPSPNQRRLANMRQLTRELWNELSYFDDDQAYSDILHHVCALDQTLVTEIKKRS